MKFSHGNERFKWRFWGVRGSAPTPLKSHIRTGGNTPCVVLQYDEEPVVIIDAGTGLRAFGEYLKTHAEKAFEGTLLLSHFHWDHIQGFPFFAPIYGKQSKMKILSGRPSGEVKATLQEQMSEPYFPLGFENIPAQLSFDQLLTGGLVLGSLTISPMILNHPGEATGFRIDSPAGSLIYICDHEHGNSLIDRLITEKAAGATAMIYDSHFTPEEYPRYSGWGHSTWLEGARIAQRAGVEELFLFHHNPSRSDEMVGELVAKARDVFGNTVAAQEV